MFLSQVPAGDAAEGGARGNKRKGGDGGDTAIHKMLWSLDSRVRTVESKVPSYFLTADESVLVPALLAPNNIYDVSYLRCYLGVDEILHPTETQPVRTIQEMHEPTHTCRGRR